MTDKKDLELIASSAKAMARHFRAFEMVEEIVDKVVNSESRLKELEEETAQAEKKLKAIEKDITKATDLLKQTEANSQNAINESALLASSRVKEIEDQVQSARQVSKMKLQELGIAYDNTKKEIERQIDAKKAEIAKLTNEHQNLLVKYAKEESDAVKKVEMAKSELEKARNMLK